ncbi:SLAP domain-containing protein [Agrilactobacillus yilanensis]|uniref:SLAP domain-containing protein n=1 Tax=Agrilactobacillus yilanensis TaxID=2485997 RepID=A0ABW4JBN9_9LACO|nr:SLAP domain-containing protein [Agrilactobacillus yilanensis]
MKQNKLLKMVAFSAVALASLGLAGQYSSQAQAAGVGKIVNPDSDSAVYVYDAPNGNVITNRTLGNGTSWKIGQIVQVSGHGTWYELGKDVWINNYMFQVTSTTDPDTDTNTTTNTDTTTTTDNTTSTTKIGTVKNPNGTSNVYGYSAPAGDTISDPTYAVGSQWKITKTVAVSGRGNWYQIGTNVWLNDYVLDVSEVTNNTTTVDTAKKVITVASATPVYNQVDGSETGQTLAANTSWAYFQTQAAANGATWYEVGGNQWIKQGGTESNNTNTGNASGVATINANGAGVYTAPNNGNITKTLGTGTQWAVSGAQTVDGVLWYRVGKDQWISSANVTDTNAISVTGETNTDNTVTADNAKVITLTEIAPVYDGPMTSGGSLNGDLLAAGTAWKINDVQTYNGVTWGLVGNNQWIDLSLGSLS